MFIKVIKTKEDIERLTYYLNGKNLPQTVQITSGAKRSDASNRLLYRWYNDISVQLGDITPQYARARCKLCFGIPILRHENEAFRITYDKILKPFDYETKLNFIMITELPVTRLMKQKQMNQYMDAIQQEYTQQGVRLTDPELIKYEMEF